MSEDKEGFLYPQVNQEVCIHCGKCIRVCPILNRVEEKAFPQDAFICQMKDRRILLESSSGGAFSAIAEYVLDQEGVVFGAALTEDFAVAHREITNKADLSLLRGSKYVQSRLGNCYQQVRQYLNAGKMVLFSGTPCQIEGLLTFLGEHPQQLIAVDVVCHAVPSPKIWKLYVDHRHSKHSKINNFRFRDKKPYGYQMSVLSAYDGDAQIYCGDISVDPYLRAFFSNICDRPSCYACSFKKRYRISDITLWDCLDPQQFGNLPDGMIESQGISNVLLHSDKGQEIWNTIKNRMLYFSVNADALTESAREMTHSVEEHPGRDAFFRDVEVLSADELFPKYFPVRWKNRAEHDVRVLLVRTGLTSKVRNAAKKIIKNHKR